ncbi:T6SS immunity protein Tdi1 domain-containing protein [Streptococcus suis]|uniref:T6SS immunity protein Tdi1 domain-containing protein n=1 Tax=Streptococcus suis TaxID=1307 RepID=UPI000400C3C1|nr:T6SS immunity protein Tdi1 domain-containing protein [Streptococcus suis]MCO8231787.1 DUF1851 domain-containing protein [Streptococcus suis]HEM3542375.1 DUF1851 domain-containing protein [Streptococcus suis]
MIQFIKLADMPSDIIEKYRNKVPEFMINFWKEYGIATGFNGYLKSVNPDSFKYFIENTFILGEDCIPLFVTGFGDVITLTKFNGEYNVIYIVKYKDGYAQAMLGANKFFFKFLSDSYFLSKYFELEFYREAICSFGELEYSECFTFVPLLALGASKNVKYLEKGGIAEYLMLITELVGNVENIKSSI